MPGVTGTLMLASLSAGLPVSCLMAAGRGVFDMTFTALARQEKYSALESYCMAVSLFAGDSADANRWVSQSGIAQAGTPIFLFTGRLAFAGQDDRIV